MTEIEMWRVTSGELTMALFVDPSKIIEVSQAVETTDALGGGIWIERESTGFHTLTLRFVKNYQPQWREVTPTIDVTGLEKPPGTEQIPGTPSDTRSEQQWCVWYGGPDPNNAAGVEMQDDETDAREALQWFRSDLGSGIAVRDLTISTWRAVDSIPGTPSGEDGRR